MANTVTDQTQTTKTNGCNISHHFCQLTPWHHSASYTHPKNGYEQLATTTQTKNIENSKIK
jgi:hypothetical protein